MSTEMQRCFYLTVCGVGLVLMAFASIYNPSTFKLRDVNSTSAEVTSLDVCREQTNVAFLKVHKAGSTTVMNILQRFGEKRGLIFAIPKAGNYLGWGVTIQQGALLPPPKGRSYNMLFNHVVYNREAFRRTMPNNTVFIAIVREPLDLLHSAIRYLQDRGGQFEYLSKIPEDKLTSFLADPLKYEIPNFANSFTNNRMAFDFGLQAKHLHDTQHALEYIGAIKDDFEMVLVLEYFEESLILMRRKLCWKIQDILYIPGNVNARRQPVMFSHEVRHNHRKWSVSDIILYDIFYKQLWEQIFQQGVEFFEEVKVFKYILQYVNTFCSSAPTTGSFLVVEKTKFSDEFKVYQKDCELMVMAELKFMDLSLKRHLKNLANFQFF